MGTAVGDQNRSLRVWTPFECAHSLLVASAQEFHNRRRMRLAPIIVVLSVTLSLLGCSKESAQRLPTIPSVPDSTSPPPPTSGSSAWLWGMVVDEGGACIVGAAVEVVSGQGLGQSMTQTTPCDAWAYDGGVVFRD